MIDLYVINLAHRKDRWEKIVKTYTDPEINLIRVEAIKHDKGWIGCLKSHISCVKLAKEKNLKNIMVIEDDCIPLKNIEDFKSRYKIVKKYLDENDDWDIYLGGTVSIQNGSYSKIIKYESEIFVEFSRAYATHMICYNSRCFDFILNNEIKKPIDEFWFGKLVCLVSVPFFVKQDPGFSDIIRKNKSDDIRTNEANNLLKKYVGI